jgi:hypothetical protein
MIKSTSWHKGDEKGKRNFIRKTQRQTHLKTYRLIREDNINITFNTLSSELNPICYLLALLAYDFLHVSRIRVKSLTLRLLMSPTEIVVSNPTGGMDICLL